VKWSKRPQLEQVCPEMVPTVGGADRHDTGGGGGGRALDAAC
jgi:hypothetical protein